MVEVPVDDSVFQVELWLLAAQFNSSFREDVVGDAVTWHVSFDERTHTSRPCKVGGEMAINERFTASIRSGETGILLIELRDFENQMLASGGLEVPFRGLPGFESANGSTIAISGQGVDGHLSIRVVVDHKGAKFNDASPRASKIHRSGSSGDVVAKHDDEKASRVCGLCGESKLMDSIVVLSCGHTNTCRRCLRTQTLKLMETKSLDGLVCRDCSTPFVDHDLSHVLSSAELDRFRDMQLEMFLEKDESIVRCPVPECRCAVEKMLTRSADFQRTANGPDGSPLSGVHLRHYNEFRVRCPKCAADFCSSCSVVPYHAGKTCQEYTTFVKAKHCRFCNGALPAASNGDVCGGAECAEKLQSACVKVLACGHKCAGCKDEKVCPPCLKEECEKPGAQIHGSDFCSICWVEDLQSAPAILLECGHMFHYACVKQKIEGKWPGLRITFGYLDCPLCKVQMSQALLQPVLGPHLELFQKIRTNAINRLKIDGMLNDEKLVTPGSAYYQNPEMYALHSFAYYMCFKCKQPYFGGRRNCEQNQVENRDPAEMVCFDCGDVPKVACNKSKEHAEFHLWKCRFCCSPAVWFCWGNTHFCEPCHQKAYELRDKPLDQFPKCSGREVCPLRTEHPAHGIEFSLGCGMCNNDAQSKQGGKKIEEASEAGPQDKGKGEESIVDGVLNSVRQLVRRSSRLQGKK